MPEDIHNRDICYVCGEKPEDWYGYAEDKNGVRMSFCEDCKVEWIKYAGLYGIKFGQHDNTFGVKDGHNACPINMSKEVIIRVWNLFIQKMKAEKRK